MFVVSASISVSKVPCVAHCNVTLAGNIPCVKPGIHASVDLIRRKCLLNMG